MEGFAGSEIDVYYDYICNSGKMIDRITGSNGSASYVDSTVGHRYQCKNATGGGGSGISRTFGGSSGNSNFDYSCASSEYAYGIVIGSNESGTSSSFTFGLKCKPIP